jgi:hypothetical protein
LPLGEAARSNGMSPIMRPCLDCGQLSSQRRCPTHRRQHEAKRRRDPNRAYHHTQEHRRRRQRILQQSGYRCQWCGGQATELDYVVPLAQGGERSDASTT